MQELILLIAIVVAFFLDCAFSRMKENPKSADRWLFYSLLATLLVLVILFVNVLK